MPQVRGTRWRQTLYFLLTICLIFLKPVKGQIRPRATTTSVPLSIPPSQEWDGNDGPWSSFTLQVGTPPQILKVFVSTSSSQTWVVAQEGCQSGETLQCAKQRGGLYNYTASSSWVPNLANVSNNIYSLDFDTALGYDGNGRYGFEDITLGFQGGGGPTLQNQTIAGIATKSFFLGLFGLAAKPSTFLNQATSVPSFMQNLKNASKIPSISWGYTAGNQYRSKGVLGSLTLGGYDRAKFSINNATFPLSTAGKGELPVQLQSINVKSVSVLPSPITVYLDSATPYLYLPLAACNLFETTFGLTWNETAQLYFITETQRTLLQAQNPSVVFSLGATAPNQVNISIPYSAFDLTASWPLVVNETRYFPLKRGNDSSQYTLGRVFFQEAYVIADYERGNFSISQCRWDSLAQDLVAILPLSNETGTSHTLSIGAIAGIAAGGGVALLIFIALLLYFCWWNPRRAKKNASELPVNEESAHVTSPMIHSTHEYYKPELDSNVVPHPTIVVHEADGRKVPPPVEIGENEIHEMAGEDQLREMPASPVLAGDGRISRFSWVGPERGSMIRRTATPGEETMSSVSSGWGSATQTWGETVSPATPEEVRERDSRIPRPDGS